MNALTNNTATLFRRYLWLLDVIYSAGRITLDEIRVRWQRNEMSGGEELPRKTFENHRKAVEELFDVNIACDRRTNEYYVECGDDLVRDDLRRWLLETFAVNDLLVNSKRLRRRIALEPIPSGYAYLTAVLRAMDTDLPVVTKPAHGRGIPLAELEARCTDFYGLCRRHICPCGWEWTHSPVIL